jgi:hypothetical protein
MIDIESPNFIGMLQATEHLGPFHSNPKIDKVYRILRIMGLSEHETKKMINAEISRRKQASIEDN